MKRKMNVVYFSGTGNTEMLINHIARILKENEFEVCKVSTKQPYVSDKDSELLLAFPINSQAVSPYIWKYLKSLPNSEGEKVNVVVTLNQTQGILKPLKSLLEKKGYVPKSSIVISMPNNLILGPDTTKDRLADAMNQAEKYAHDLVNNQVSWNDCMKGNAFVSFLSRDTVLPWVTMRVFNKLEVDMSKCRSCGLCVKECPVQNIRMEAFPVHMNQCQFCMHCGAVCKNGAIHLKGKPESSIRNVNQCVN